MSLPPEIPLPGGEVNDVVRVGDTVRRTGGPWSRSVQAVLTHLEQVGFSYAPRPLGIDDRGREVVSYLPGRSAVGRWPTALLGDDGLHQLGTMAGELSAALQSYPGSSTDVWRHGGVPGPASTTLRHGDLGLQNTIWVGNRLVGVIDWDYLEPAPVGFDLAQLCWYAVPLRPQHWAECGFAAEPDYSRRLAVLAEHSRTTPAALVERLLDLQRLDRHRTLTWGAAGVHPWDRFLAQGYVADIDADAAWLRSRRW